MSARTAFSAMLLPWISEKAVTRISIRLNGPGLKTLLFRRKMSPLRYYDLQVARQLDANTRKCFGRALRALGAFLRELHTSQIYYQALASVTKTFLVIRRTTAWQYPREGARDRWPGLRGTTTCRMKRVACPVYMLLAA